jgi:Transposase and inactivated derivatives
VICCETFRQLDSFVWRRLYRWAKLRHPNKTGRWIAQRYFPHLPGETWRFTDPKTGQRLIRVMQTVKPQRHIKIKAQANPFDPLWEAYFQQRDRQVTLRASSPVRATILSQQQGDCPGCRQVIQTQVHLRQSEDKLKRLQRGLARKEKGSNNRAKWKLRIARIHERIANQRSDFLHQFTTGIVRRFAVICVESLNLKGLVQTQLAKSLQMPGLVKRSASLSTKQLKLAALCRQ